MVGQNRSEKTGGITPHIFTSPYKREAIVVTVALKLRASAQEAPEKKNWQRLSNN
ncbi:hypothetical protein [Candidatus Ichthyocystis sparus]|uniref:hypothetical protein n=1 Tax=Candidatus Ichthyocystis sparus TaxID=1561004 RepID=UPI00159EDE83|nr:hypothetical protein [Candidatus Ichthyocystis sparus]